MQLHHSTYTTKVPLRSRLTSPPKLVLRSAIACGVFLAFAVALLFYAVSPPTNFPVGERIVIEEGSSVSDITTQFKEAGYVRSETLLYFAIVAFQDPTALKASAYRFPEPLSTLEIAYRLTEGSYGVDLKRFVHYEGESAREIAARAEEILEEFDTERFLELAEPKEGRLFPDTYLIPETFSAEELVTLMESTYETRLTPLRPAIKKNRLTEKEVIVFASLLEREANTKQSKRIVAGILHNRLEINMPLQVDAAIAHFLDKPGTELTYDDLATEDPYNTYLNTGLPPGPIGNPGLDAIQAVLEPAQTEYLFYLTGRDGNFYYAQTFAEHERNISNYLR